MGTYVQYWHGSPDGLLGHFLAGPLEAFRDWCVRTNAEYADEIDARIAPLVSAIHERGSSALYGNDASHAELVDRLLDTYYGFYCDSERPDLLEPADDSFLYVRRYEQALEVLQELADWKALVGLWRYLLHGRGVGRDAELIPYRSEDGVFRLSYWTAAEVSALSSGFSALSQLTTSQVDAGALGCTRRALSAAQSRGSGLIITVA